MTIRVQGRQNFKDQLQQLVGSIQYTNDLDVHVALITAQSYAKERAEKYYMSGKTNHQLIREYIDLFGFMSKNINAMVFYPFTTNLEKMKTLCKKMTVCFCFAKRTS